MPLSMTRTALDRSGDAAPLHTQITGQIRQAILSGALPPGEPLPSEPLIEKGYGVSRSPVRRALDQLEWEGLIERRPGLSARVALRPPVHRIDMRRPMDWPTGTTLTVLGVTPGPADAWDIAHLALQGLDVHRTVLRRSMLISDDDGPVELRDSSIPAPWPAWLTDWDYLPPLDPLPEIALLTEGAPVRMSLITATRMATGDERDYLRLRTSTPVWDAVRVFWLHDRPVEASRLVCPGTRVEVSYEGGGARPPIVD